MIKILAVCLWVSEAGLFAWEVDGPGSISLWWILVKIIKQVVENCYGNTTLHESCLLLREWPFESLSPEALQSTGCHLGCSIVAGIKYTQIPVLLLWIYGIMKCVEGASFPIPEFATCNQNDLGKTSFPKALIRVLG